MGATDILNTSAKGNATSRLVAPSFLKSMSRIILTILVVGGSYFGVSEGLRFLSDQWGLFVSSQIEKQLGEFSFTLGKDKVEGIENMSAKELQKVLYLTGEKLTSCQMAMASVEEISRGAK